MGFMNEQVEDFAKTIYDDKIKELIEKYGIDRIQPFLHILSYRETDRIGWNDKVDNNTDKLIDNLRAQIKQELATKLETSTYTG